MTTEAPISVQLHSPRRLLAMCVSPAVVPSGSEGSEDLRPTTRPSRFVEAVINFRSGGLLEECLLDIELVRLAQTCRLALSCMEIVAYNNSRCWVQSDGYGVVNVLAVGW